MTDLDDLEKKARDWTISDWGATVLDLIARYRKAEKAAEFNLGLYQGAARLLNEECEKTEQLQARVAELEAHSGEVVGYKHMHMGQFIGIVRYQQLNAETKANYLPLYLRAPQAVPEDVDKEAARYRWLRDNNSGYEAIPELFRHEWWEDKDAAIDAAMLAAATSPEGE